MQVEINKVVAIYYTLSLDSGDIIVTTKAQKPKYILVGYHQIIPGLEKAILELKIGDQKKGTIDPKDAYGPINEKRIRAYPRNTIPNSIDLKIGRILKTRKKNGQHVKSVVKSYNEKEVILDSNHPYTGETLNFKLKIVHIREATREELESGKLTL